MHEQFCIIKFHLTHFLSVWPKYEVQSTSSKTASIKSKNHTWFKCATFGTLPGSPVLYPAGQNQNQNQNQNSLSVSSKSRSLSVSSMCFGSPSAWTSFWGRRRSHRKLHLVSRGGGERQSCWKCVRFPCAMRACCNGGATKCQHIIVALTGNTSNMSTDKTFF